MAGFDKHMAIKKLKKAGWFQVDDSNYLYPSTKKVLQFQNKTFYVYDAEQLEGMLDPEYYEREYGE